MKNEQCRGGTVSPVCGGAGITRVQHNPEHNMYGHGNDGAQRLGAASARAKLPRSRIHRQSCAVSSGHRTSPYALLPQLTGISKERSIAVVYVGSAPTLEGGDPTLLSTTEFTAALPSAVRGFALCAAFSCMPARAGQRVSGLMMAQAQSPLLPRVCEIARPAAHRTVQRGRRTRHAPGPTQPRRQPWQREPEDREAKSQAGCSEGFPVCDRLTTRAHTHTPPAARRRQTKLASSDSLADALPLPPCS